MATRQPSGLKDSVIPWWRNDYGDRPMTDEKPVAYMVLLHDCMETEKEQVAREIKVTDFGVNAMGDFEMTTSHGEHWHKVVRKDSGAPTIDTMRLLLDMTVDLHASRLPKHQEFLALAKEATPPNSST